jgi:nucleotide-binding universal stress UspA family protein
MRWLIVIDGSERSEQAADFAAQLAMAGEDEILLFAVRGGEAPAVEAEAARLRERFDGFELRILNGRDPAEDTVEAAAGERVDVVVYGSRGRRGLSRLLLGSVAARLEHDLSCSLLVVRGQTGPIHHILVATGLYQDRMAAVETAGRIAGRTGARVTVLHVMSQLALNDQAPDAPLQADAAQAIHSGTWEGEALQDRLVYLRGQGIEAEARLRHGLVLDEVASELDQGDYDLLIIGGHRVPDDLPFANLLAEDVADDILMNTQTHVLIA